MTPEDVQRIGGEALERISECFKPGVKLTLLVRTPSHPDGSRDFVLTDDDLGAAIEALTIRRDAQGAARRGDGCAGSEAA